MSGVNCPYRKSCGGCTTIGQDYESTLRKKEKWVENLLRPYVRLDGIVGMEQPLHYRNKVHRVCSYERFGGRERHIAGIYAEGTHRVVPVKHCLIENETADAMIDDLMDMVRSFRIRIYNEDTGVGLLRHILIRTAHATGQVMVVLVLTSPVLPGKKHFLKALLAAHPEITTVVININDRRTSMVLGEREQVAYGPGFIEDVLLGKRFRISSRSFYQVNSVQAERIYAQAIEYATLKGRETVVDAYCGIGTIGLAASDHAGRVIGVESNADAAADAAVNAKLNHADHALFICDDAADYLQRMAAERKKADVIFMDPPRSGSSEVFLEAAVAVSPGRIVYISCNPETLARDLGWLSKHGYRARKAMAFDQFCFADHVETVVLMSRIKEK